MSTILAPTTTDLRSAAVSLAEQGLSIFPCRPGGKEPLGRLAPHGFKDASCDPALAYRLWTKVPDANIGMPTGQINGRMVIDFDPRNGADDEDLPPGCFGTTVVRTPGVLSDRGPDYGIHIHFACPGPQRTLPELQGIGLRGDGAYVIVPPSTNPNGVYEWFRTLEPIELPVGWIDRFCPEMVFKTLPGQLQDRVQCQRQRAPTIVGYPDRWAAAGLRNQVGFVLGAPKGHGNDQLNTSAFIVRQIVDTGYLSEQTAFVDLTNAGLAIGLAPREVRATVASGMSKGRLFKRNIIVVTPGRRKRP